MNARIATRVGFATALAAASLACPAVRAQGPAFQVPPGFVVEKVAGPPLVRYPLFACFDDRGRLFVAEGTGTNLPGAELAKKKLGRILVLEDTDGDGKFDTSAVFADQLVFPQGVLWHDGALYAASHPSFWRFPDAGRNKAGRREELATGFNFNGNGCDIHGPFLGPDGRLYWTDGRHGYRVKTREGRTLAGLAARIWRCRPDGTELERLCGGGFDNPVELAWTADGEMIGTMDQGPGDCLLHYVEGGVYPMEHPCIKEFPRTGPLLGAVQRYSEALPAALCGTMRYRSRAFGPEYRDALFTTHYMTHKVVRSTLVRDGSTFQARDSDFLVTSDPHVRLTDVLGDADGSLLVVDMGAWFTYGFLGNPVARPQSLGAIYRIRKKDAPKVADPWGKSVHLARRSARELVTFLDDPRPAVRDGAVLHLAKSGAGAVVELEVVLRSRRSAQARRNAVWALCQMDAAGARAAVRLALGDEDVGVRMAAVHAAGLHRDAAAAGPLARIMKTAGLPLRRKTAEALGRIGKAEAVPALLEELRRSGDRFLEHSLIYALIRLNDRAATLPALSDPSPRVRRGGLIALDQMRSGNLTRSEVVPLLDAGDADLQQTALEVIARRPGWASAAHAVLRKWLASPHLSEPQVTALNEILVTGSGEAALEQLVAESLTAAKTAPATRTLLVGVIGRGRDPLPKSWAEGLRQALTRSDLGVQRETVAAIQARKWRQFDAPLLELSRRTELAADVRLAALECLAGRGRPLDGAAFALLSSHLATTAEPLLRLTAARTLAASSLTPEQLVQLAGRLDAVNTMTLRMLLPLFSKSGDARVAAALAKALAKAPAAGALTVAEVDRALKEYPATVREGVAPLREKLASRQKGQAAYLARLTAELDRLKGDPDAGKEIFLSPKHGCYACHRAVGRGGNVGPDLSQVGRFRTRAELLESVVFPNLTIAPQYVTHQVTTKDGRAWTGLILRETADAIFLRTTDLAEVRVARKEIDEVHPSAVSLMPEGLERTMTRQELRDLLEFLCRQR
jgi:putative heme-binding domain-containing protein